MSISTTSELFGRLLVARTQPEIDTILRELGDKPNTRLNEPFGPLNCSWVAYGDSESNQSTIGLAGKAGKSLTERVTNGIDAMLELSRLRATGDPPKSPGEAASTWYGRPETGPASGLFSIEDSEYDLSRFVSVVLADSGVSGAPTVDVIDAGIGLTPEEMPRTILSLQQGNKVKKPYLMGTFGQGGASTLAFCKYAVILSRSVEAVERVGFTIVRLIDTGTDYKLDVYAYLTVGEHIPFVDVGNIPLSMSMGEAIRRPPQLLNGTVVRHVEFQLSGLDGKLSPSTGNLYHYLHQSMFDTLLPFRVMDIRDSLGKDESIGGSRNRLMKLASRADGDADTSGKTSIRHHREMEDIIPLGSPDSRIGVEYWVVEAMRKTKGALTLRSSSSELFVQKGYPVIATLNGQNHGELAAKFLKDLGFGMLARHMVVHLDASRTDRKVRRELFTTTREGFKEGSQYDNLTTTLGKILKDDHRLAEIERELTDRLVNRDARTTSDRVKRQIAKLLRDAGFGRTVASDSEDAGGDQTGGGGIDTGGGGGGGGGGGRSNVSDPLPTLLYPEVTSWQITVPQKVARVRIGGRALVRVETDAADQFEAEGRISIEFEPPTFEPPAIEVAAVAALKGGRKQWHLRCVESARVGNVGMVTAVLQLPDESTLRSAIPFEVAAPVSDGSKGTRGNIPDFEVIPISPDNQDHSSLWGQLWLHEGASRVTKAEVAYKVLTAGEKIIVYYSTGYGPYVERVKNMKSRPKSLAKLFEENYQIWIGYHAILQLPDEKQAPDDQLEALEHERCRVAQVLLRVASELAELQSKAGVAADSSED